MVDKQDHQRDELLTVADVAELLKLNQQTVRNWIDRGELPAVRVGQRRVRVWRHDVDAFLEHVGPAPATDAIQGDRAELAKEFEQARQALATADDAELAAALRALAAAAGRLADRLPAEQEQRT